MFSPLTKVFIAVIAILAFSSASEYLLIRHQVNTIDALRAQLAAAKAANDESQKTIAALRVERTKASDTCEAQLEGYDATLAELKRIDELTGGYVNVSEISSSVTNTLGSGNVLLDAVNSMYPAPGGQSGVCQASGSPDSGGPNVLSSQVRYCFCSEQDVRNLLKNNALDRGDRKNFITILDGQR